MYGIRSESFAFLEAVLTGMILYSAYICLCLFRQLVRHIPAAIAAEDLFFWLGSAVFVFVQIHHTTSGRIRWYFALGVVLGSIIFCQLRKKTGKLWKNLYEKRDGK